MVVVLNSRVQLIATVSTSGVLAEEKRRVAVPRFADARNPPTGEIARERRSVSIGRAPTCHDRSQKADRDDEEQIAVISDVAAAVSGALVVVETANSGTAPASASSPPMIRPGPDAAAARRRRR